MKASHIIFDLREVPRLLPDACLQFNAIATVKMPGECELQQDLPMGIRRQKCTTAET